jgi:hypothetical protein
MLMHQQWPIAAPAERHCARTVRARCGALSIARTAWERGWRREAFRRELRCILRDLFLVLLPAMPGMSAAGAPAPGGGPNPTVAGILAGFFPFGVGAVYTGQYAKGLAHLATFVLLIAGANASDRAHSEALGIICGFGIAFFYVYQIIDSVRTAKAIQMAQPIPDPFRPGSDLYWRREDRDQQNPNGRDRAHFAGRALLCCTRWDSPNSDWIDSGL